MELDLESMTETYVLSLEESQFDSCLLSTCHSLKNRIRTKVYKCLTEVATTASWTKYCFLTGLTDSLDFSDFL